MEILLPTVTCGDDPSQGYYPAAGLPCASLKGQIVASPDSCVLQILSTWSVRSLPIMSASAPQPSFSEYEVAQHNGVGDLWVIIDEEAYDLSDFTGEHPGGPKCMHFPFLYKRPIY